LRKVYVTYDAKGKKFIENKAMNKMHYNLFESQKPRETSPSREFSSNFKLSHDPSVKKLAENDYYQTQR